MKALPKELFFSYHANSGGKLLTCYINSKLEYLNQRTFMSLPVGTRLELPTGLIYTIPR